MDPSWGMDIPLLGHFRLSLFSFLVGGVCVLFSRYRSQTKAAAKKKASKQQILEDIRKLIALELEESKKYATASDLACIPGRRRRKDQTQDCILCSIDRSFKNIFQHLENASSALKDLNSSESDYMSSPSISDTMSQDFDPPCCCFRNGKHSSSCSISSQSSNSSSILSDSVELTPRVPCSATDRRITPMALLPVMDSMGMVSESHSELTDSVELTPKVPCSTTDSRKITPMALARVMDSMGIIPDSHSEDTVSVKLTPKVPCSATNRRKITQTALPQVMESMGISPDLHSEDTDSVELTPKVPWSATNRRKITPMALPQVMESMGISPDLHSEDTDSVELTPKVPCSATNRRKITPMALPQVMESMGISPDLHSEDTHSVELTPKVPRSATESRKITPMALLQVMESMGIIPDSLSEDTDSMGKTQDKTNLSQPSNQAETVSIPPESSNPVANPQRQTRAKSMSSRLNQITKTSNVTPTVYFNIVDREIINELCLHVTESGGIAPKAQHQVIGVDTLHKHQVVKPAKVSQGPHHTVFKAGERLLQPQHKVPETFNMDSGSQNQATKEVRFTPSSLQPSQRSSKVLDSSRMIPEPPVQSMKVNLRVQGSRMGVIPPLQAGLIAQSVAQTKASLELPSASQVQVRDSIGMTQHPGTENLSLTPKPPHQVMDPSEFTPWHQDIDCSEVSPRESHKMIEPMALTSDTWPQWKNPTEMTPSHHQMTESVTTASGAPDQGTVPTGMSQRHQFANSEVMPATPKLQEVECLEKNTTPRPKVMQSINLTPKLQNGYSKSLVPDPSLQDIKPVDVSIDLVPEIVIDGLLTPTVVSTDLAPEQQQSIQSEELTLIPQLQIEKPVPSAPESLLQDVKSAQLTVEPQLPNVQSARLAPNPQVQNTKTVNLTPGSQSQGGEGVLSSLIQEVQEDIKMVSLTARLSLEDVKSANLVPKPCSQNTSSEKIAHVPLLEDTKIPLVDCRSLIPESLVESTKVDELTTQLYAVKSSEVSLNSSYSFPDPEGLTENQQASETRVTSDTCHQVEESAELTHSSVGMTPAPPSQTSESIEMDLPPLQDILETRIHLVKEMETPELQTEIKDILNLLPELEVPTINPEVMTPEPQPPDMDFAHVTLEPCSDVTNPSELNLYEYTERTDLTLPEVDESQGTTVETYSEMGSQGLNLEPRVQIEESGSLVEKLKIEELTSEPSGLVVEPIGLTTGPISSYIIDVIPGPQVHNITSTQIDTGLELQSELSVDLGQQPSIKVIDPEITKQEPGLQTLGKESVEGTQIPNVKSMDLNLGQEQPIVKSGLTSGPQLQSVRFPKLYQGLLVQGDNPANSILGPPHYGVKSDEAMPEIRSSGFILGPKIPEPQPQHVKSMEVNLGPCLQDVRFSEPIPKPKLHGFKYTQFMPGFPLQERTSQGFIPELLLPLSQEPKLEDRKLVLPIQGSEFHSMKFATQASELQHSQVIPEEVNTGPWKQDTKFSELASGPKLQGVKFGEQISGLMFVSGSSMTPELGIQDPNLAKTTPGLQDTRQMSFNTGPQLQDVKFWDGIPGTQPQGVKTSELNSGPHLESVKIFELTTPSEGEGMKTELVVYQSPFQDVKYITGNQVPSVEDKVSYETVSEPQVPISETTKLAPGRHLANVDHSELIRRPQTQGIASSELAEAQLLGHIKPVEDNIVSKQEALTSVELTPGLHLGDIKSTKLKSELEHVRFMLSTSGMQSGDRTLKGLPPGYSLKGLKPKFLPSKPTMEDRKSVILTVEECLKRIKSTAVSPTGSLKGDMKSVKLIPGSRIQDVKNKGLARDTHVQDVNAMDLKLEPKKQGENTVTSVSSKMFQDKPIEVFQGPQLQGIKSKELTSQPQMQYRNPVIAPCLKRQSLKPVTIAKTQGIREVKCVDFTSTQQCQGMAPMDLSPKSREDDQRTLKPLEWKGGIFDQQKKQLESENTLPMESAQEPKPAHMKPIELNPKLKFKDTTSFELGPQPIAQSVKSEEFQNELQVPSMKPCQLTPGSQMYQQKALESTLDLQLQGMDTLAQPPIGSTKALQWIPISEFQSEKGVASNSRLQSGDARATELKPPMLWRSVKSSELTARSKSQGEKKAAFYLESQLQGVKTSPLQEPNPPHLTPEPQTRGIPFKELNKEPKAESIRSVPWTPRKEFQGVKMSGFNSGSPFQGVKWTEQKPSTKLGGGKPSETTQGPTLQGEDSGDFYLRPQEQTPGRQSQESKPLKSSPGIQQLQDVTSSVFKQESQSSEGKSGALGQGSQSQNNTNTWLKSEKSSGLALQIKPQGMKTEMKSKPQEQSAKCSDLTTETKSEYMKFKLRSPLKSKPISTKIRRVKLDTGPQSQVIKSDSVLKTKPLEMEMEDCESDPKLQDPKSLRRTMGVKVQDVKSMSFCPRSHVEGMSSEVITEKNVLGMKPVEIKLCQKLQDETPEFTPRKLLLGRHTIYRADSGFNLQDLKYPELIMGMKLQGIDSMEQHLTSIKPSEVITQTNSQDMKAVDFDSEPSPQCANSFACTPGSKLQCADSSARTLGSNPQCADSSACIPENPELHSQAVNSSVYTLGQNHLCENSNRYNLGPLFQGMNFSSFPPPQILCVNPVWCNNRIHLKDINSSACTLSQQSQSVNSIGYNPGAHLQAPKPQEQHLKDLTSELNPGSNNLGISPSQDRNASNLMLGAKFEKIPVWKNQLGSQQQSTQPMFTLRPQSNGVNSVVLPTSPPEDRKFPEKSTHTQFCTNAVKLTPGCGLNHLRRKVFSEEPSYQNVEAVQFKPASQFQTVSSLDKPMIVLPPQSTRKLLAGPALNSVKFSNLPLKSEQKNTKSLAFPSEPKWQGVKQVKLSSVRMPEIGKSVELPPKSILQNVKPGNLMPQTIHPLTESMRPERQLEDFAEMSTKPRCQVPKSVHFTSPPVSQDVGSLEFTNGVGHKSKEMTGKSMRLSSKPTDNILESSEMPPKQDLQVPESFDLTTTVSDQDSISSDPNQQKSYQIPEPPELYSWSWPLFQDFKKLQTKEVTDSDRMTLNFRNRVADPMKLTCEAQQQGEEFRMTPKVINREIGFIENFPRPRDQVTESVKTQLSVPHSVALPKVCEFEEVISRAPLQVTKSVMIPESTPQMSKYNDLTSRTHDAIRSEFPPSLRLQNVQSKKVVIEPKHQALETKQRPGFPLIKTVVTAKPLIQIVKSEEVAPGPCPQAVEPTGLGMRPSIRVKECLNLHPRPHLQDLVKPMELTQRADSQVTSAELISQQTSPLKERTVSTHEQRLQAAKSLGLKTESPKIKKIKDSNQGSVCQNKDSEATTPAKLDSENSLSRSIYSPSIRCPSIIDRTTELGHSQGSGVPKVSRAFGMQNIGVGIFQSSKSYTDSTMIKSSVLPLVLQNLPSDRGDAKGTLYPDIWSTNVLSKEESKKKMEELQGYSSNPFRLLSAEFQARLGARRSSIHSLLGIQQNVWESHVCRQRLPRKYLSNMLMLGNVLGTTMERKPCSQPFSVEGSTTDSCQSIENLFGVPAELMEFSQSLLERVPRTMSQTSVDKKYIQRHIFFHSNEKRIPLKMWTRGSTSSIIQRFSGTRLGVKKPSSKYSDIFEKATEHVPVSCTGARFPDLMRSEILYTREDSVSREQSKISPCAPSRTFESQHSLKTSSLSQSNTDNSEHLLRELKLKIAGKLIRSQIPHNVPPPLDSGLVLKYPICLECGRCSGLNCSHKLQSAWGPYLLIYPQLHLLNTPEGHGDVQLRLGFKLGYPQTGTASPSHREARFSKPASKHPDYGSNQDETWIKSSLRKTSVLTDPLKKIIKGPKTQNTRLYKISPRTLRGLSRNRIETPQTSTVSSKTQTKKSSRPKIIQPLVQGLRQAFQAAHRIVTFTGRKLKKMRPGKLCSVNNLHPNQSANDYFLGDSEGARTPAVRVRSTGSSAKQKDSWQGGSERGRQASQPKPASSLPPRPLQSKKTMVRGRDEFKQTTSVPQILQNVYGDEAPKNQPQQLSFFRERTPCNKSERSHCMLPQGIHWRNLSKRRHHSPSRRRRSSPSDRTLRRLFERSYQSPSQRNSLSPSVRSFSDRSLNSLFKGRGHSPSRRSPLIRSRRSSHSPLRRSPRSPSRRILQGPSRRNLPSPSGKIPHSSSRSPLILSRRSPRGPSRRSPQNLSGGGHYSPSGNCPSRKSLYSPSRSPSIPSWRSPHSPSRRSLHRRSGKSPSCLLGRNLPSPSRRSPHRSSRRSPCRPLERRGHSPSVKNLHSLSGRNQQSPSSLRCLSSSKKSHLILTRRSWGSPSERSHGDFSERSFPLPSGWKRLVLDSIPTLPGNSQVCSSGVGLNPNITWQ